MTSWWSVDARTLGAFRIAFGLHLLANLYDRTRNDGLLAFYTDGGVLPGSVVRSTLADHRTWSVFFFLSTPAEVRLGFALIVAVFAALTVGYRTKAAQILTVVCLISLDNRNVLLQHGGTVVTSLLAVWTALLPLGARFSIDRVRAMRAGGRAGGPSAISALNRAPARFVHMAYVGVLVNFAGLYAFAFAHKHGAAWRDGSAVHWVLWQNRFNTACAGWLRWHEPSWFSPLTTYGTLVLEGALPLLILSPVGTRWTRRMAIVAIIGLHGGISLLMTLGPFSYAMMCFAVLLVSDADWAWAPHAIARLRGTKVVDREPLVHGKALPAARLRAATEWTVQLAGAALLIATCIELAYDNKSALPEYFRIERRPKVVRELMDRMSLFQGWYMFAPDAPKDDGTVVIDALLSDGRHLDPRLQMPPDFDAPYHGPWYQTSQWAAWEITLSRGNPLAQTYYGRYIRALDQRPTWNSAAKIRSLEIYWVSNSSPLPGQTAPFNVQRKLLFAVDADDITQAGHQL